MARYPPCNLFLSPQHRPSSYPVLPVCLFVCISGRRRSFNRVIFHCLPCGHMKVTVPGCVCVHIDGAQNMRASIKDRTGRQDVTHVPTTRNPCPKQESLTSWTACIRVSPVWPEQSLPVPDPNAVQTQQRAPPPPNPSVPRLKKKRFSADLRMAHRCAGCRSYSDKLFKLW